MRYALIAGLTVTIILSSGCVKYVAMKNTAGEECIANVLKPFHCPAYSSMDTYGILMIKHKQCYVANEYNKRLMSYAKEICFIEK